MDTKFKAVISDYDYGNVDVEKEEMEKYHVRVVPAQCKTEEELIDVASDAHAIITQYARVGRKTIERLKNCRVIARYGTGVDIVDVAAATEKGIQVTNVPDYCTDEVADHAVALLLTLIRKLINYNRAAHEGIWRWQAGQPVHRIRGSKLGLIGFGKIGRAITTRAKAFGMEVMVHDPYVREEFITEYGAVRAPFEDLLPKSDYIVIQAPLTEETRNLFGDGEFRQMKRSAILINTARGPIVNNRSLYRALKEGWIAAAGLDDTEEEPAKKKNWRPDNPLFTLDNVIITPHAAYYSEESIEEARRTASQEVVRVLTGKTPKYPVNKV
ncbi:MAG: C-terminal binding protein [Deltaproteobacteria bacterium]|nr:C-terminal binding protein [Deltaproteobacteria bacterium]